MGDGWLFMLDCEEGGGPWLVSTDWWPPEGP